MTDGENFLLSCVIENAVEDFFTVSDTFFHEAVEKDLKDFIEDYYFKYKDFPSISVINDKKKKRYRAPAGDIDFYYNELKLNHLKIVIADNVPDALVDLDKDPEATLKKLVKIVDKASYVEEVGVDLSYSDKPLTRYESYIERKKVKGITYVSTGVPLLDELFNGWNSTDVAVIGGRSGLGKTWLLLTLAIAVDNWISEVTSYEETDREDIKRFKRLLSPKRPILLVSNEMNETELSERMDSMNFKLPYSKLLKGTLSRSEERRYLKSLKHMEEYDNSSIVVAYNCNTLDMLKHKIDVYKPVITFVDGSYLLDMDMEEGFAKASYLTRKLKSISMGSRSPIIHTTQLRKKGGKAGLDKFTAQDDFFYGSYIQDSDFAIRASQPPMLAIHRLVNLEFVKGRRMADGEAIMWSCDPDESNFNFNEIDEDEEFTEEIVEY